MPILPTVIVHGGCHDRPIDEINPHVEGTQAACAAGYKMLQETGSAMDAVRAAIRVLEDNPVFDAGTGSFPNIFGDIEMDAFLATSDGQLGGVAGISRVQYPIDVAFNVMTRTPHVLLVGDGATQFARALGIPDYDPSSVEAQVIVEAVNKHLHSRIQEMLPSYTKLREGLKNTSTVGAVAIDADGLMVAGTSTGGIPQKLPGRIGDAAIFGAGTYADAHVTASATGFGEDIIRLGATRMFGQGVARGLAAGEAMNEVIDVCSSQQVACGLIGIDAAGNLSAAHNGFLMASHYQQTGMVIPELACEPRGKGEYQLKTN
ncbi:MAG: isoaspartyl peptidase/L-asparaginase [Deinococcota bacterium]